MLSPDYVLGLDVGGTSSRALLADLQGEHLGSGSSGGGNPTSRGRQTAGENVMNAVDKALTGHDPARVAAVVMGVAGILAQPDDAVTTFQTGFRNAGLNCPIELVGDSVVAFAAGSSQADGTVLIAGTGAIAVEVFEHRMKRRCDGYGWMLGDRGSGIWLGKEAVYAALRGCDGSGPGGRLVDSVVAELTGSGPADVDALIHRAMEGEPVALSRLAPLVTAAADAADPVAVDIVERACAQLVSTVSAVRRPDVSTPIVLSGSLAAGDNAVSHTLRRRLRSTFDSPTIHLGRNGAAGAAWLAARRLVDEPSRLRQLHHRLTST